MPMSLADSNNYPHWYNTSVAIRVIQGEKFTYVKCKVNWSPFNLVLILKVEMGFCTDFF